MLSSLRPRDCSLALATATLFLNPLAATPPPSPLAVVTREVSTMGTHLRLEVAAPTRLLALAASEAAVQAVGRAEMRLSTWRSDTELAAFNRHPVHVPFPLSPELSRELAALDRLWRLTDGTFDPGIGPLVDVWDLRGAGRTPTPDELAKALAASGWRHVSLSPFAARREHPGLRLEEGAFGKGAALDDALAALGGAQASAAVLNFGGQVAMMPDPAGREVELAHPLARHRVVAVLRLHKGSLATSSNGPRRSQKRSRHLLDPRTGRPAADFGSLTVWAPTALEADALSTGLYILGPEGALAWAARHPGYGVVVVELRGTRVRVHASPSLSDGRLPVRLVDHTTGALP